MSETQATQTTTTGGGTTTTAGGGAPTTTGGGDWRASLPAEYQNHAAIKDYKDPGALVKSHIELQSKFGSRKMQDMDVPADDAGRAAVLAKLGLTAPAKPEEYGLKYPDGYKGPKDDAELKSFMTALHEAGIPKDAAQKMFEAGIKRQAEQYAKLSESKEAAVKRTEDHFRKAWGADYDKNKAAAEKAWAEEIQDPKLREAFEEMGIHLNPVMVDIFAKIGRMKANQEGGTMWASGSGNGGGGTANTVEALRSERTKIEAMMKEAQAKPNFDSASSQWREMLSKRQEILGKEGLAALSKQAG